MFCSLRTVRSVPGLDLETLQENHLERISHTRSLDTEEEKGCISKYIRIQLCITYQRMYTFTPFYCLGIKQM